MKLSYAVKGSIRNLFSHRPGKCNICGKPTVFVCIDSYTARNNMYCLFCGSTARKRHIAKVILERKASWASSLSSIRSRPELAIYSTDINESFHRILRRNPSFVCSGLFPEFPVGTEISERVYCQNLEELSFADGMFDVVITEDVFEHVRDAWKGFDEVHRVLKPGGCHVFTVPFQFDRPTLERVDTSIADEDVYVLPPEYHRDKIRGKILAYRKFGFDVFQALDERGFETGVEFSTFRDERNGIFESYVFVSTKTQ